MYAAAGGASLASRQARKRQQQNKQKSDKASQLKGQAAKLAAAIPVVKPPPQGKAFHNLPANYQHSAIKLSRVERNALRPPATAATTTERRHSTSNHLNLKEPTTRSKIRESPSILLPVQNHLQLQLHPKTGQPLTPTTLVQNHIPPSPSMCQLPQILVPPSLDESQTHDPERRCSLVRQYEEAAEKAEKTEDSAEVHEHNHVYCFEVREKGPDGNPLMYTELDRALFGSMDYPFSECSQGRAAWQERERERRCSQSEAAHNHRVKQTEAHHRWMKRNRIHDTSYGGSSDEEDFFSVYYQSAAANALLYVGLGTTVIGLVIWFVGTGEKGFKTLELRLIGPTLIALGLFCCLVRVLLCVCPSTCFRRRKKTRLKNTCPHRFGKEATTTMTTGLATAMATRQEPPPPTEDFVMVDHNTSLLGKSKKRVSIAPVPCTSGHHHQHHKQFPLDRESLMAATTVFLQHEKERSVVPKPIPTIEIPDFADFNLNGGRMTKDDSLIELQNLELSSIEVSSVSSGDSDSITIIEAEITKATPSKLHRTRQPKLGQKSNEALSINEPQVTETCLSINMSTATLDTVKTKAPPPTVTQQALRGPHSGIVLSPSKLGQ